MKTTLRVLHCRVGQGPAVVEIPHDSSEMHKLVGGWLDLVRIDEDIDLWCNDEGALEQDPKPNAAIRGNVIFGDFFIARHDGEGETVSLTDEDIKRYSQIFAL